MKEQTRTLMSPGALQTPPTKRREVPTTSSACHLEPHKLTRIRTHTYTDKHTLELMHTRKHYRHNTGTQTRISHWLFYTHHWLLHKKRKKIKRFCKHTVEAEGLRCLASGFPSIDECATGDCNTSRFLIILFFFFPESWTLYFPLNHLEASACPSIVDVLCIDLKWRTTCARQQVPPVFRQSVVSFKSPADPPFHVGAPLVLCGWRWV